MTIRKQNTINKPFFFSGVGLHSGQQCTVRVSPAEEDHGITFIATEDPLKKEVLLTPYTLDGGTLGTNLLVDVRQIKTVEHFLATVCALEIDNLIVEVSGGEMPIRDGSANEYLELFESVGVHPQSEDKQLKRMQAETCVEIDDKFFKITPRDDTKIVMSIEIDFDNDCVRQMPSRMVYHHTKENFVNQIAKARTFGFQRDLDCLLANGLCLGGSLHNAILFNEKGILNPEGLRFSNEIIAHKILDIIGDLYPMLTSYCGFSITAYKPGHLLNNRTLRAVYESVTLDKAA